MQTIDMRAAPNPVDAVAPIATAKESYGFISTRKVLDVFESRGWLVDKIQTNRVNKVERQGFQKHLVWLRNPNLPSIEGLSRSNSTEARLCLANAHDMTSAYHLFFGGLRAACLNQIMLGNVFRYFRASHSKNVIGKLNEGIDMMTEGLPEMIEGLKKLQAISMNQDQRLAYAKTLVDMRLENVKNVLSVDYSKTEKALRAEDTEQDAYTVMNRVQEYVIRGGIPYTYERKILDEKGNVLSSKNVSTSTRKLASIASQMKLNQALVSEIYKVTA